MSNYALNPKRRCTCEYHIGNEPWHGTSGGRQYHCCNCELCKQWIADYMRDRYQARQDVRDKAHASYVANYVPKTRRPRKPTLVERRKALWTAQNGRCAMCGLRLAFETAHLDHDHACCNTKAKDSCGECDRAAVHPGCNNVIALAENTERLNLALTYLARYAEKTANARAAQIA